MMVMVMVMMPFVRNFYLISDYVCLFCPVRSVTLPLSAIGPLSALPLFDVCSSSVQDLLCLCSFICVSPLNNSLTFFALSQFFLFLVSGVSRMGRLTAPGVGEDNVVPLLSQGVHSLHLDTSSFLSLLALS